jgi:hypothetical protein
MKNPSGSQLMRSSFELLKANRKILWLPVISAASSLLVTVAIAGPFLLSIHGTWGFRQDLVLLIAASVGSLPAIFFNVAITYAASEQIEGRMVGASDALRFAWTRRSLIARWALFSGVVGLVLRVIENRIGILSKVIAVLGALSWAVAVFFIIPVLTFEGLGPKKAIQRSSHLLRDNFGTVTRGALAFGGIFVSATFVCIGIFVAGVTTIGVNRELGFVILAIGVIATMCVGAVSGATSAFMRTILYRHATGKSVPNFGIDLWTIFQKKPNL